MNGMNTKALINAVIESISNDIKYGAVFYEDEKFIETIESIDTLRLLLAQEFKRNAGVIDND